ncbi:MAG: polyphosphate kinase 2 family protein [Planctomycetota bacterium]
MFPLDELIKQCSVTPGKKCRLKDFDPDFEGDKDVPKEKRKDLAQQIMAENLARLEKSQELLYASDTWSILVIFQAMDAAGKDSTIKHVMSGINPQGCQVYSFKHPSAEELDHNFLWRCSKSLPERGRIGIFNRSYYEEVLIVQVHPELVEAQRIPAAVINRCFWEHRYEDINRFEQHLSRNGTKVIKFFLNVSKAEQRRRFLDRIEDKRKHWKLSLSDINERECWDQYQEAYEQCLTATSTEWAPWYVIPADHKWVTRTAVSYILSRTIDDLQLSYPTVTSAKQAEIELARKRLEAEK